MCDTACGATTIQPRRSMPNNSPEPRKPLRTVGLFAGIGGIERGLSQSGHQAVMLVEIDEAAVAVLQSRFPGIPIRRDVRSVKRLPPCDLISAGFPCQDLSQCGKTEGIKGQQSSLVREVFRLVEGAEEKPTWLLLENVPFMLRLDRGRAMTLIASELRRLGYKWAYRTIDARAFGVPQRRQRVVLLASQTEDPRAVLFSRGRIDPKDTETATAYGFYWTEGSRGLGWAVDSVPTLKGGSSFGIPSPPAVWIPDERRVVTIDIRDAERMQGFPSDWTKPACLQGHRDGARWRLVGNAVCCKLSAWLGRRLAYPGSWNGKLGKQILKSGPWPRAAYGDSEAEHEIEASMWPVSRAQRQLLDFLRFDTAPLSARATAGFLSRAKKSRLRFVDGFLADVAHHLARIQKA